MTVGPMNTDGSGDPGTGASTDVQGFGDSFAAAPNGDGNFEWQNGAGTVIAQLGRPYIYLFVNGDADGIANGAPNCHMPCLISMGPDGEYDQGNDDDIVVNIGKNQ